MSPDLIPALLLSVLLLASGGDVDRVEVVTGGVQQVDVGRAALVVTAGDGVVPADVVLEGPVHVLDGSLEIRGTVTGDVLVLGGEVLVADAGEVAGDVRRLGGAVAVAPGGTAEVRAVDVATSGHGAARQLLASLAGAVVLGLLGWRLARRRPGPVTVVADAVHDHPVITLTVGGLVGLTGVVVLTFMAFTLLLLPVAAVGLLLAAALLAYGVVAVGEVLGREVLSRAVLARAVPGVRPAVATGIGSGVTVVGLQLVQLVPVVGGLLALAVLLIGLGAVLVTYLGLKPFVPVSLPA